MLYKTMRHISAALLYYEFDAPMKEFPLWQRKSYKQINVISSDEGRYEKETLVTKINLFKI